MIVRAARPHQNFTVVHNEVIEDARLSWKARGLLVYLLSKPDHWRTTTAHLASQSAEGIHSVRTGLSELALYGYIKRLKKQNAQGQWSTHTVVFDRPQPVDNLGISL
jgi:hypothetical protein